MDIPKFNTLVEHTVLDGDKVKIDDLLNKVLVITGFSISTSKYKDKSSAFCVKVQFYYCDDDKKEIRHD